MAIELCDARRQQCRAKPPDDKTGAIDSHYDEKVQEGAVELETCEFGRSGWIWIYGADWVDVCSKQQKHEQKNHAWKDRGTRK